MATMPAMTEPRGQSVIALKAWILKNTGLNFANDKDLWLASILELRMKAQGIKDIQSYLAEAGPRGELDIWISELVVPETYFMRNRDHFAALKTHLARRRAQGHVRMRLLSAGCATGEEAYSLAIAARMVLGEEAGAEVSVLGGDLHQGNLQKASKGVYSDWSLRDMDPELEERYLKKEGKVFKVSDDLRRQVRFEAMNLSSTAPGLLVPESFEAIFVRNVLMYFAPTVARAALVRLAKALVPGGLLFLGHAESLRGVSGGFELCHTHNTFYYRRRGGLPLPLEDDKVISSVSEPAPPPQWEPGWQDAIAQASQRILEHSDTPPSLPLSPRPDNLPMPIPQPQEANLEVVIEALHGVGPARALELMGTAPAGGEAPRQALWRAALTLECGENDKAKALCETLLNKDDLNAGAHYLNGFLMEQSGELDGAEEQYRLADYLDGGFAMPHFRLGLLAKARGDRQAARRELALAAGLFEGESEETLKQFGGGFTAANLRGICLAGMRDLEALNDEQ